MIPAVPVLLLGCMLMVAPMAALAQTAAVPFGRSAADTAQPVEITADRLELDQSTGIAVFTGSVRAGQGALRLAADRMQVIIGRRRPAGSGDRPSRARGRRPRCSSRS